MASGILGRANVTANGFVTVYTVPANTLAVVTVSVAPRSGTNGLVSLALSDGDLPSNADYIEFASSFPAPAVLERTGVVLSAGQRIIFKRDNTDSYSVVVYGFEEPA